MCESRMSRMSRKHPRARRVFLAYQQSFYINTECVSSRLSPQALIYLYPQALIHLYPQALILPYPRN